MGLQLALRLADAGADLSVYNRTRAKTQPLADRGARVVDSPADLADRDIVFTMVSGPKELLEVALGTQGVLAASAAPGTLIDASTVSSEASETVRREADRRGTPLLAAPISGNAKVVRAGQASVAVSGPEAAFDNVRPYLAALGRRVQYVGDGESARLVKIAHNLILGAVVQSLVETTLLAERAGIRRADYLAFVNDSVMGSVFSRYKTPALVALDWTPTFTSALLRKDLDLGLAAAAELGVRLPLTDRARDLVQEAIDAGHVDDDFAVLLEVQARAAGMELVPSDEQVDDGLSELPRGGAAP